MNTLHLIQNKQGHNIALAKTINGIKQAITTYFNQQYDYIIQDIQIITSSNLKTTIHVKSLPNFYTDIPEIETDTYTTTPIKSFN